MNPTNPETRPIHPVERLIALSIAVFAASAGVAACGFLFLVLPWIEQNWASAGLEGSSRLGWIEANRLLLGAIAGMCAASAVACGVLLPRRGMGVLLALALSIPPLVITGACILAFWTMYADAIAHGASG